MTPEEMTATFEKAIQAVQQAAQAATQAAENATQTAQQAAQLVTQMTAKLAQTTSAQTVSGTEKTTVVGREELGDIGGTERLEKENYDASALLLRGKITTQNVHEIQLARLDNAGFQVIQNAITTTDALAKKMVENLDAMQKQHMEHRDLAVDNHWNPIQQAAADVSTVRAITIDDASLKALGVTLAAAIADALMKKSA